MSYEKYFNGHDVPKELKEIAILIMKRFTITGLCDGMYICNVIAEFAGIGDGEGIFTGNVISNEGKIADYLQNAYSCNIRTKDKDELTYILKNKALDVKKAVVGLNEIITNSNVELAGRCEKSYITHVVKEAKKTLEELRKKYPYDSLQKEQRFLATDRLGKTYQYVFVGEEDTLNGYNIHLHNETDGDETFVEKEWFSQRTIQYL